MNKNSQADCQTTQLIEKEYINSMLGIDNHAGVSHDIKQPSIDYKEAYENDSIECQVFNIAGLQIAVPALHINEPLIQQTLLKNETDKSQSTLCAGKVEHDNEIIEIIDIEHLLMNGVTSREISNDDAAELKNIALIKGSSTGFIYDEHLTNQVIPKENIRWRDSGSERIWLAGTITQMGLALLDIEGLINLTQRPA